MADFFSAYIMVKILARTPVKYLLLHTHLPSFIHLFLNLWIISQDVWCPESILIQLEFWQPIIKEINPGAIDGRGWIHGKIMRVKWYGKNQMSIAQTAQDLEFQYYILLSP